MWGLITVTIWCRQRQGPGKTQTKLPPPRVRGLGGKPPPLFVAWGRGHNQFSSVQFNLTMDQGFFFLSFFLWFGGPKPITGLSGW